MEDILDKALTVLGGRRGPNGSVMVHCPVLEHEDRNPSLQLTQQNGKLLVHCFGECNQDNVIQALKDYNLWPTSNTISSPNISGLPSGIPSVWKKEDSLFAYSTHWPYRNESGEIIGYVVRYDAAEGGKQVIPFFQKREDGRWKAKGAPEPRPLYRLDQLVETSPSKPVLVVEGEKIAEAAQRIVNVDYFVVTWPGGSEAVNKADWTSLKERNVIVWPDNDDAGKKAAQNVAKQCKNIANSVTIIKPPAKDKGWDLADAESEGWQREHVTDWIKQQQEHEQEKSESQQIRPYNLEELIAADIPQRSYHLKPSIPTQGLSMFFAPKGLGKTFFSLTCSLAMATGTSAICWEAPRKSKVLYIDGEMPADLIKQRVEGLRAGIDTTNVDPDYFKIVTPDLSGNIPNLATKNGQEIINAMTNNFEVLILDNLSSLLNVGEENSSDDWQEVQDWLLRLRRWGKSVVIVHHAGKSGDQRGASRKTDILDTVVQLSRPRDYMQNEGCRINVQFQKVRSAYGEKVNPFEAKLEETPAGALYWTYKNLENAELELVRTLLEEKLSLRDIAEETGLNRGKIQRLKNKLRSSQK